MDEALDIQHDPDPTHEEPPARRIPHLGHTLLYFSLNSFCFLVALSGMLLFVHDAAGEARHPFAAMIAEVLGYLTTLAIAVPLFPQLWQVSFWEGISWNPRPARLYWIRLIALGVALSIIGLIVLEIAAPDKKSEMDVLFSTPLSAWLTAIFAPIVAAIFEEIAFRGFLLPSLATTYDWLSLERTPAALQKWMTSSDHSLRAWIFGTAISSIAFASLHGPQYHWAHASLAWLFCVSAIFSVVRIRTRSVATVVLLHAVYDGFLFVILAIASGGFRHLDKLT